MSLTVAVTFNRVSAERRINGDQQAQVDALAVAGQASATRSARVVKVPSSSASSNSNALRRSSATCSVVSLATASTPAKAATSCPTAS